MKELRNNLTILLAQKAKRERRRISLRRVAEETGINPYTVYAIANDSIKEYSKEVVVKLCGYLDCDVGDLLTLDEEGCATLASAVRAIARVVAPDTDLPAPAVNVAGVRAALRRAAELAGDHLEDLADQLDDAEYEALARLLHPEAVPTLESEGIAA